MRLLPVSFRSRRRVTSQIKDVIIIALATGIAGLIFFRPHYRHEKRIIQSQDPNLEHRRQDGDGTNTQKIFTLRPDQTFFHTYPDNNRYISGDTWRPPQSFGPQVVKYDDNKDGQFGKINLQQRLTADHTVNANKILLLLKTGSKTLWDRVPVHFFTTLTRFPNFALYSDAADSIAGYEVVDILANVSQSLLLESDQFSVYRSYRQLRSKHNYLRTSDVDDIPGGWELDKFKNIRMFYHAYKEAPDMEWYVMIDDDTIILADNLSKYLRTLDPRKEYYLGSAVAGLKHIFAHGGSGIVLSQGAMKKAFGSPSSEDWVEQYTLKAENECCGDYMVAMYLKETADISLDFSASGGRFQGEPIWAVPCSANNWCQEIITLHHQGPADFELLWEYERVRKSSGNKGPILYRDIYNDFAKPYLSKDPQKNWDNGAKDVEYSWAIEYDKAQSEGSKQLPLPQDASSEPYASFDLCKRECEAKTDCIMYRYDPYSRYCGLSSSTIALGRPVIKYDDDGYHDRCRGLEINCPPRDTKQDSHQMISGWYLDRAIAMRKAIPCDKLHKTPDADGQVNGVRDQVEGWYIRAKSRYPDSFPDPLKHL
ncbi:hypothetical protein AWJ20_357 [Sugiyamaella lignohabitans]|uniref:N-acetylgalactosaminide beta-1,3-galactosyltransferase n=1 Tax=Sugiyamaella lignohabitans TaxID=796027 RepID=A0A167CUG6_9ASCO|nr:uncharacterized protein AWJ20_357 [Sugiyamaella lignohabitans]ANB12119.1 hypothetical protein AWJ20_357 [Sugiyamaella lignohabitans]